MRAGCVCHTHPVLRCFLTAVCQAAAKEARPTRASGRSVLLLLQELVLWAWKLKCFHDLMLLERKVSGI